MKMTILILLLLLSVGAMAQAATPAHGVDLTWGKPTDATAASLYKVYRANGLCSLNPVNFTQVGTPVSVLAYSEDDPANTSYCFYVTHVLNGFESVPSNKVSVTTLSDPTCPTNVAATGR
jgi:hypothetical protein